MGKCATTHGHHLILAERRARRFKNSGRKCPRTVSITAWMVDGVRGPPPRFSRCSAPVDRGRERRGPGASQQGMKGTGKGVPATPRLEVRITTVLVKSTVFPFPSVSRPSSNTCKRHRGECLAGHPA